MGAGGGGPLDSPPLLSLAPRETLTEFSPDEMTPPPWEPASPHHVARTLSHAQSPSKLCQGTPGVSVAEPPRDRLRYGKWLRASILSNTASHSFIRSLVPPVSGDTYDGPGVIRGSDTGAQHVSNQIM